MLRLLESLPQEHARAVACPPTGSLPEALDRRGIRRYDFAGTEVSLALHPVRTPVGLAGLLRSAVALRQAAREFGADVIHANSVRAGLIAVMACRLGGPAVAVQCHDHLPHGHAANVSRKVIARGAEGVVAVTDDTAARFNHGLRHPKAERVYISVDHRHFSPVVRGSSPVRSELGLAPDTPLLGHVAQITPWKGQETSIRALARIRESHNAHLLVVGEVAFSSQRYDNAGYRQSLERLVKELGVAPAVHFLGQREDVAELMGACHALLLPSWDEPFGLVVAEAMACGTPVLVTSQGGVREYVEDGVNGYLLDPQDARAWARTASGLLTDEATREGMGAAAVQTASQFTDERYASNMLAAYERAVRARSTTAAKRR